ncbi:MULTISPECIES: alpha/beta fold hydrolase [unclassified Rathayibacter]|uniref:alpha/beta fold hydrolase n=1 Tax=unclassified Rathayibacter TaxID=2609250 RepID=UPI0006F92761|nr:MULTISPECIES: alpha/beta hydrolase [unclassified Rathayibacter]KQQ03794.1 hydrolase [Rathayibacter sp. Leaf294]KQS12251.1 hydrolase [Rathayibacter sp. Leaf185]
MRLSTTTTGDGERHVGLVHGLGADGATWAPLVDRLVATGGFTVTTVDLRGHGGSDRASSYRLHDFADDLAESLPADLHAVVGHSLGGSVLVRAVARLRPARAVYLDPGFALALPTTGMAGRLFWAVPQLTMGAAGLVQARKGAPIRRAYPPAVRTSLDDARRRFDGGMAIGVFRDVAFHPVEVGAPAVPSTIVLSDDSPAVLPDALATRLEAQGWAVRRLPGVHHDMHLEAPERTFQLVRSLL